MFADDCIVYIEKSHQRKTKQATLQDDLDELAAWEEKWGMDFHPQLCSVLRVSRAKTPMTFQYKLKGTTLMEEKTTKYLGVTCRLT